MMCHLFGMFEGSEANGKCNRPSYGKAATRSSRCQAEFNIIRTCYGGESSPSLYYVHIWLNIDSWILSVFENHNSCPNNSVLELKQISWSETKGFEKQIEYKTFEESLVVQRILREDVCEKRTDLQSNKSRREEESPQWMSEQRAQSIQRKFSLASYVYQMSFSAPANANGDQCRSREDG